MEEKEKRTIDDDPNVYKVLAMLFEPIVVKEYEEMKAESVKENNQPLIGLEKTPRIECSG